MPCTTYYLDTEGGLQKEVDEEQMKEIVRSGKGALWVDLCEISEDDGEMLSRVFGFHRLTIEDCVNGDIHPPKIDDFDTYLFAIIHGINHSVDSETVETAELAIYLGPNYVVSAHSHFLYSVDSVAKLVEADDRPLKRGADFFAYVLMHALIGNVMPTIDKMADVADAIDEEVIHNPHQSTLEAIMKLKRSTQRLRRVMSPQREVLNRLARREFKLVRVESATYFRDAYDDITRIEDMTQALRDRADTALSTQLSSVANRQNETMRILAIVATVFLPLGLVAGIYGMNFANLPGEGYRWGFYAVVGFCGVAVVVATSYFWARKLLAWSRRQFLRASRPFAVEPEKLVRLQLDRVKRWSGI